MSDVEEPTLGSVEVRVHEDDDPRIERILDLIDEAARPRPLEEVLGVLCSEVAAIAHSDVASIYVRDEDDDETLVMRANVGFPGGAIGKVRLSVGEGITGFAAECMRPVTVFTAHEDERWKAVPGLGEEEFPVFLALPILVGRRAEAVLVLQRRRDPYELDEVVLATALATSFAYALERARAREEHGDDAVPRHAHLAGRARSSGAALGRLETLPTFEGLAAVARARGLADESDPERRIARVMSALDSAGRDFMRGFRLVEAGLPPAVSAHLHGLFVLWDDERLRDTVRERAAAEANPTAMLRDIARIYTQTTY
ncbi:MAG: GAF domain-containing protein, partial [Sandaracinaceae bacterium]